MSVGKKRKQYDGSFSSKFMMLYTVTGAEHFTQSSATVNYFN